MKLLLILDMYLYMNDSNPESNKSRIFPESGSAQYLPT